MSLICPKCNSPMEPVTHEGITVDRCTSCRGLWFDLMEHRHLRELPGSEAIDVGTAAQNRGSNEQTKILCPKCKTGMVHMRDVDKRSIEHEYCSVCNGVFFDAGEFAQYKEEGYLSSLRGLFGK